MEIPIVNRDEIDPGELFSKRHLRASSRCLAGWRSCAFRDIPPGQEHERRATSTLPIGSRLRTLLQTERKTGPFPRTGASRKSSTPNTAGKETKGLRPAPRRTRNNTGAMPRYKSFQSRVETRSDLPAIPQHRGEKRIPLTVSPCPNAAVRTCACVRLSPQLKCAFASRFHSA